MDQEAKGPNRAKTIRPFINVGEEGISREHLRPIMETDKKRKEIVYA